jgi:hypothetical protein
MKMTVLSTVAAAATMAVAANANAAMLFYNGAITTSDPIFVNPGGAVGSHYYDVVQFTVDVSGAYTFEMASPNTTGTPSNALDTYLRLYANAFNPPAPGAGQASSDDFTGTLTVLPGPYAGTISATATGFTGAQPSSRLNAINLVAGTNYFLVNTSFRATTYVVTGNEGGATGPYYTGINGPGNITIVPAPGALALLGLGGLLAVRRRRA